MTDWFRKAIIYQILIDRFAGLTSHDWDKPRFLGGNIKGIIDNLDYLKDLGVNTLWLSPFYRTSEYHGYAVTDFYQVEPNFGKLVDLQKLIEKAHGADMHIIADFVPNHCSRQHPFFVRALENKFSQYVNWFHFRKWPDDYLCFLDVHSLPKLNLDNPETREHIIEAAKKWLGIGFDGFRLDHVIGPKHRFWNRFRKEIKATYPEAVLLGEAWIEGVEPRHLRTINIRSKNKRWKTITQEQVQQEYCNDLDGVLDFCFLNLIKNHVKAQNPDGDLQALKKKIDDHYAKYPEDYYLATFLDNHDTNRFLFECDNVRANLFEAARLQFGYDQPVIIYYGTEVGMTHARSVMENRPHADLEARHPMVWDIRKAPKIFEFINKDYLEKLKRQRVAVFAMHVPLDKNSEYSTSTTLAGQLGLDPSGEFYEYFGVNVGVFGKTSFSNIGQLNEKFEEVVGHRTKAYNYGSQEIKDQKVGVIGGGGLDVQALDELKNLGINTFVTGVTINNKHGEKAHDLAKDYKINLLGGTHYSTEKFACIKMCEYFQKKGLESEFLEDDPVLEDM